MIVLAQLHHALRAHSIHETHVWLRSIPAIFSARERENAEQEMMSDAKSALSAPVRGAMETLLSSCFTRCMVWWDYCICEVSLVSDVEPHPLLESIS